MNDTDDCVQPVTTQTINILFMAEPPASLMAVLVVLYVVSHKSSLFLSFTLSIYSVYMGQ